MALDSSQWVKDGTASAAPVTESTPDTTTTEAAPAPPTAPATETGEAPPAPSSGAGRDPETGKFVSGGTTEAESLKAAIETIEAQLDGKPYQIPKTAKIPFQANGKVEWVPIEEARLRGMREADYRRKTMEAAEQRRQVETERQQMQAYLARVKAREQYVREQEEQIRQAQLDPEKWVQFERHLEMLKHPQYRKTYEDALAKRETDAELQTIRQQQETSAVQEATEAVNEAIGRLAGEYQGVDVERVRVAYGDALIQGRLPLSEQALRQVFDQEAQFVSKVRESVKETELTPLQKELAEMKAQLAELKKQAKAEQHNVSTQDKIAKSKTPGAPVGGSPPAPKGKGPLEVIPGENLEQRARRWGKG